MSPNHLVTEDTGPLSQIAERVMKVGSLTYEVTTDGIVLAVKLELLVDGPALNASPELREALAAVAEPRGSMAGISKGRGTDAGYAAAPEGPLSEVEIWRLTDTNGNSIDEARRLRCLAAPRVVTTRDGHELKLPAVTPNHAAILSVAKAGGCPATPPSVAHKSMEEFIKPPATDATVTVTVLDSGYIPIAPPHMPHHHLDGRVTMSAGEWLDTTTNPASWHPDRTDGLYTDPSGRLDGISGHGTFIAGLISHHAPMTRLNVVGLRNQEVEIGVLNPAEQLGLFETEAAIARAMVAHSDADVIQCGFAFPTLDDHPSLPFAAAMAELRAPGGPRGGHVAVVAPAGNEQSSQVYWPAALPDVIGVAATNRDDHRRAWFSNWGEWCDCCASGEHVYSTFVYWDGPIEGEPIGDLENFIGWAHWNGTSFAAPKVSAEIARVLAENPGITPTAAWHLLRTSITHFVIDEGLTPGYPVSLPRIPDHG